VVGISCFKCGAKGSALKLVREIDSCSYKKAEDIARSFILRDFEHLVKKVRKTSERTILPTGTSESFLPIHDRFLASRRYDRAFLQRRYDLMAIGPTLDDWKFRIIIPVYLNEELVTYVGRDTTGKADIPYKNAPIEKSVLQAKHTLYGLDNVKDTCILVEGIFDAWRIGLEAVPTFGTQVTDEQIYLLAKKNIKRCIVLFDEDATSKAETLAYSVSSVVDKVEYIALSEGDPDDLTEDEVWELKRCIGLK
jgi:DNA primase